MSCRRVPPWRLPRTPVSVRHATPALARGFVRPLLGLLVFAPCALAQSDLVGWGRVVSNSAWNQETFVEVAAGDRHTLLRRSD